MTLIPFSTFLPDVALYVPGCPQPIVEHSAIRVLADFGRDTCYETETLAAIDVTAGQADYVLSPSLGTNQFVRVEKVLFSGDELQPVSQDELDAEYPGWRDETGTPRLFTTASADATITLVPKPDTTIADALIVEIATALKPSASPTEFNSTLYDKFGDGLVAGICSRLMMMPGRSWTNLEAAAAIGYGYKLAVAKAKDEVDRRQSKARLRTRSYYR